MTRKKPETKEDILDDIQAHPDRGMLDGEDVVRFESINIQFTLPRELENQLLEIGACLGMSKSDVLRHAIASFVSQPGNQAMISRWQENKGKKYGVEQPEIKNKVFGSYKKIARRHKSRLDK